MSSSRNSSSSSEESRHATDEIVGALPREFDHMLDVRLPVSVVLGSGSISVRECLALGPRSIVRLQQSAGDDVQVLAGHIALAKAEVVIIEDSTAVRLTEILRAVNPEGR